MKLTIFSVALILLTYLFRVILKEWLNDLRERIGSAETLFRTELNSTVLQLQVTKLQMDIDAERGKSALLKAKRTGNFSSFIINDRLAVASRRGKLGESEQSVLRVLKALPRRSRIANMKLFEPIQGKVKEAIEEAIKAEKASLLPNSGKDWTDSSLLKIQVMKLALVEILGSGIRGWSFEIGCQTTGSCGTSLPYLQANRILPLRRGSWAHPIWYQNFGRRGINRHRFACAKHAGFVPDRRSAPGDSGPFDTASDRCSRNFCRRLWCSPFLSGFAPTQDHWQNIFGKVTHELVHGLQSLLARWTSGCHHAVPAFCDRRRIVHERIEAVTLKLGLGFFQVCCRPRRLGDVRAVLF